jgi:hypothetical protein
VTPVFTSGATRLALLATAGFAAAAVAGALLTVHDWSTSSPLIAFHALLLIHTYFSIRCFSSIAPHSTVAQILIDGVLVAVYVFLPFQFADPTRYLCACVALFLVAIVKYALMLGAPHSTLILTRKMLLDLAAAMTCGLALSGVVAGVPHSLGWWLGIFFVSHVYILLVSRFYFPVVDPVLALGKSHDCE